MLDILISSGLVWLAVRLLERGRDSSIDGFVSLAFVFAPAAFSWVVFIFIPATQAAPFIGLALLLLYVIIPALMLRRGFGFTWGRAIGYGLLVLVIVLFVSVATSLLFAA